MVDEDISRPRARMVPYQAAPDLKQEGPPPRRPRYRSPEPRDPDLAQGHSGLPASRIWADAPGSAGQETARRFFSSGSEEEGGVRTLGKAQIGLVSLGGAVTSTLVREGGFQGAARAYFWLYAVGGTCIVYSYKCKRA